MGASLQTGAHVVSGLSDCGARNCGQTPLVISIALKLSGCWQFRCTNIAQAIDWLICLHHQCVGGKWLTHFAEYAEVNIALL